MNLDQVLQGIASFLLIFAALSWVCGKIVEIWHLARNVHGRRLQAELARCFGENAPSAFTNHFYWHPLIEPLSQPGSWFLRRGSKAVPDPQREPVDIYPAGHLPGHIAPETFAAVMLDPFPWPTLPEGLARMLDANRMQGAAPVSPDDSLEAARVLLGRRREVDAQTRWDSFLGAASGEFHPDFGETPVAVHAVSGWDEDADAPMARLTRSWSQNQIVPERLRARMLGLIREAEGDIDQLRAGVARWYREAMDRASGRFQREAMAKIFLVAAVVCLALNVNVLAIGDVLLGQLRGDTAPLTSIEPKIFQPIFGQRIGLLGIIYLLAGGLLAAALAAVGAPFWYDLLDKVSRRTGRGPSSRSSA